MKQLIVTILLFIFLIPVYSQKAPIKFGKIDKKDLLMTTYKPDTSASAVVLCEYGFFDGNEMEFTHIIRLKVLKEEGLRYANWKFSTGEETMVEGLTYNLVNGEIEKEKLSRRDIFYNRFHNSYYITSIAMPSVKVGSVIDLKLIYPLIPNEWYFQRDIPVKYNELILQENQYIAFRRNFFGHEFLSSSDENRYIAKDMPAFKSEPYMSSRENFITKFEFDILDILIPGYVYKIYTESWEHLSEFLEKNDYFGKTTYTNYETNQTIKKIEETATSDKEKMILAYEEIQNIHFNGWNYIFTTNRTLGPVFDKKDGNAADINLLLFTFLEKMELNPKIIVMSTRDNGILSPIYPSLERLNSVIVQVQIEDQTYLLDATDPHTPYFHLPQKDINGRGRIVNSKSSGWVDLTPTVKHKSKKLFRLTLDEEGVVRGTTDCIHEGYDAWEFRESYYKYDSQNEFVQQIMEANKGLVISDYSLENLNSIENPVKESCTIEISDKTVDLGTEMYLFPFLCEQRTKNPFTAPERKYPVDYIYQYENGMTISIQIPDGWEVVEAPKPVNMSLPGNAASVISQVVAFGNTINLTYRFTINKTLYNTDEYQDLRAFYDEVIKLQSQPILIKKAE